MKHYQKFLLAGLSVLALSLTVSSVLSNKNNVEVVLGYANGDEATYYNNIDTSNDSTLLANLQSLNTAKRQSLVGYDNMPSKYTLTDPGTSSGQVTSFYSGKSAKYTGNMNREHVWPASKTVGGRGNDPLEDDIHMTRPTLISDNSSRGNSFFTASSGAGWDPGSLGDETYRGDSARIIFYCVVADSRLSLVDRDYDASTNHTMGKLSTLLKWNLQYPVLNREKTRNEQAEKLQGNRNPFIDHPEYACRIWGNYNADTRSACASQPKPPVEEVTDLSLDVHEKKIEIGGSFYLHATITPSSLNGQTTLDWFSDDNTIASVDSNGFVKGLKNGTTIITVCTPDMLFMDSCTVVVGTGKASSNGGGCSGSIMTTSIILSTLSLAGTSILLFKKIKSRKKNNV